MTTSIEIAVDHWAARSLLNEKLIAIAGHLWQDTSPNYDNDHEVFAQVRSQVLSQLHFLTLGEDVEYISCSIGEDLTGTIVAITERFIVQVAISGDWATEKNDPKRVSAVAYARTSISAIELVSITGLLEASTNWPRRVSIKIVLAETGMTLPLDERHTPENIAELVALFPSLRANLAS